MCAVLRMYAQQHPEPVLVFLPGTVCLWHLLGLCRCGPLVGLRPAQASDKAGFLHNKGYELMWPGAGPTGVSPLREAGLFQPSLPASKP